MAEPQYDQHVHDSARNYANLKHDEKEFEERRKRQGIETLELMTKANVTKVKVDFDDDTDATVSVKKRERTVVNEDKLKKAIGARTFNKLQSKVLDEAKLEAAVRLGDIDPNVVSACLETTETPYLEARFTKKRRR